VTKLTAVLRPTPANFEEPIIRGHLELLGDDPDDRAETVAIVLDELDRMSRMVDDLLVLAQAELPDFQRRGPMDLAGFTTDLFVQAGRRPDRHGPRHGLPLGGRQPPGAGATGLTT
jgi:hypothetical protein